MPEDRHLQTLPQPQRAASAGGRARHQLPKQRLVVMTAHHAVATTCAGPGPQPFKRRGAPGLPAIPAGDAIDRWAPRARPGRSAAVVGVTRPMDAAMRGTWRLRCFEPIIGAPRSRRVVGGIGDAGARRLTRLPCTSAQQRRAAAAQASLSGRASPVSIDVACRARRAVRTVAREQLHRGRDDIGRPRLDQSPWMVRACRRLHSYLPSVRVNRRHGRGRRPLDGTRTRRRLRILRRGRDSLTSRRCAPGGRERTACSAPMTSCASTWSCHRPDGCRRCRGAMAPPRRTWVTSRLSPVAAWDVRARRDRRCRSHAWSFWATVLEPATVCVTTLGAPPTDAPQRSRPRAVNRPSRWRCSPSRPVAVMSCHGARGPACRGLATTMTDRDRSDTQLVRLVGIAGPVRPAAPMSSGDVPPMPR
jgi:hypothetical protein